MIDKLTNLLPKKQLKLIQCRKRYIRVAAKGQVETKKETHALTYSCYNRESWLI